jgi:ribonuclease III
MKNLKKLEEKLEIKFKDKTLLKRALIHRSYLNEVENKNLKSNERFEFLGDAVLELWTTKQLFENFPDLPEGILTNIRAALVCTKNLAETAKQFSLGDHIFLSKGEEKSGGRENKSILADTFEALIGGIYLDSGWEKTAQFLKDKFQKKLIKYGKKGNIKDAKTLIQEIAQEKYKITPEYKVLEETGLDHAKTFISGIYFDTKKISQGKGDSKRKSEEKAAERALTKLTKKGKI